MKSIPRATAREALRKCGIFGKDTIQSLVEEVGVFLGEDKRGTKLDHVVMRAISSSKNAAFAQTIHDIAGLEAGRFVRLAVRHKVQPQEKTGTANVSQEFVSLLKFSESRNPIFANSVRILLQLFIANNIQDGKSNRA